MNQAGFSQWLHKLLWCEAAQTASDIDNIFVVEEGGQPKHTLSFIAVMPSILSTSEPLQKCV